MALTVFSAWDPVTRSRKTGKSPIGFYNYFIDAEMIALFVTMANRFVLQNIKPILPWKSYRPINFVWIKQKFLKWVLCQTIYSISSRDRRIDYVHKLYLNHILCPPVSTRTDNVVVEWPTGEQAVFKVRKLNIMSARMFFNIYLEK